MSTLFLSWPTETGAIDPEIQRFNTPGFTGCLSGVKFNSLVPLKAIFRPNSSPVNPYRIKGRLVESNCASMPSTYIELPPELDPWYIDPGKRAGQEGLIWKTLSCASSVSREPLSSSFPMQPSHGRRTAELPQAWDSTGACP